VDVRPALVLAAAALLTACGDDAPSRPADDALAAATRGCDVSRQTADDPAVVPEELRPAPAQVTAAERSGDGFEARVVYGRPLREVMRAVLDGAQSVGDSVRGTEYEGHDGEVFLSRGATEIAVRLFAVRDCPQVTQGVIRAAGG
jgi:hypothetical protein